MLLDRILRKSSISINNSADLDRFLRGGSKSKSGVSVTHDRALHLTTVFACIKILAESVGQLPLHLLQEKSEREKIKAKDHDLYWRLNQSPMENFTSQEWLEWLVASLAGWGNAYCQINRVRGTVRELPPFQPHSVQPKINTRTREVSYAITLADGKVETLPAREVFHVKLLPLDGVVGASPIRYARESIGLAIGAEEYGSSLFANGASPGGVLQSPKALSDKAYENLKDSWEQRHMGAENANRVAILEDGVTWQAIGMPAKDAQFLETRKYQRSDICGLFRVPPHMVGDLERATFSNIEHQGLEFVVHTLMPYLTRIEKRINLQLLEEDERRIYYAKFNVAGLLRGDMAARSTFYTQMTQNGVLSPNDIRDLEDMNAREGGDVYLQPANMIPSGTSPAEDPSK